MRPRLDEGILLRTYTKLAIAQFAHVAAWAAYYTLTREIYAGNQAYLLLLAAGETIPTIAGLVGGILAERYGYRLVFLLGLIEGLGLIAAGVYLFNERLLWVAVVIASLSWSISGPQIYAYTLTYSGQSGKSLGIVTAGSTLGWTVGSLAPILALNTGPRVILIVSGVLTITVYVIAASLRGPSRPAGADGINGRSRFVILILVLAALSLTGVEIIGNIYMGKMSMEAGVTLYSLANAAAGLIAAIVRPLAGRIIDSEGPFHVLATSLLVYIVYLAGLDLAHGPVIALIWIVQVYPFFELSLYKLSSLILGEAIGVATVSAGYSLTGALLALSSLAGLRGHELFLVATASFSTAIILALAIAGLAHGKFEMV